MQQKTAQTSEDSFLVEQCRRGDSAAMERLITKYHSRIYNTILRICANADDAAELTQETFVKVIENISDFEGRSGFYTANARPLFGIWWGKLVTRQLSSGPLGGTKEGFNEKTNSNRDVFFVAFISLVHFACNTATETGPATLAKVCEIHLQWAFNQTPVTVFVDNAQVFSGTVSSSPIVGVAEIVPVDVINGLHFLRVTVSNTVSKDSSFTVQDTLFIGVTYSQQDSHIGYYYTRNRFGYR